MKLARYLIDVAFITFVRNSLVALLQAVCPQSLSSAPLNQAPVPGYRQVIPLVCWLYTGVFLCVCASVTVCACENVVRGGKTKNENIQ